ncbi:zinc finger and BTB domain-containing protein 41 [Mytilus galloprovincialis]|uniref:Zinc finger and BTB domain-containing protein 41 n=1 Tax=Mytilus galloprovincialis TaxID=29158 RepID=A0A8B6CC17_MYTGA|nr:zinc finger and BTB domain-containing protein 41 [Mytilus galloprovincialis]
MSRINIQVGGHRDTVLITLQSFQQKETLCDVTIITKDGHVKGHSVILASGASTVLCNQVFTQRNNGMNSIVYINCPEFTRRDVNSVLQFLYLGVINIDIEQVPGFLALCSAWQLQVAASMLEYYLKQNCIDLSRPYISTNQLSTNNSQSGVSCNVSASLGVKPNLIDPRLRGSTNGTSQLQTTNSHLQHLTSNETMVDRGSFTYIKPKVASCTNQVSYNGPLSTQMPQEWPLPLKDGLQSVETLDQYGKPSVLEKDGTHLNTNNHAQVQYNHSATNIFTDVSPIHTVCHESEQCNIPSDIKIPLREPICTEQLNSDESTVSSPNSPLLQLQCEEDEPFVNTEDHEPFVNMDEEHCPGYSSNSPLVHTKEDKCLKGDNCLENEFTLKEIMLQKKDIQKQAQSLLNQTNSSLIDEQFQIVENQFKSNQKSEQMTVNITDNWYESSHILDQKPVIDDLNTSNSNQDQDQIIENPYSLNHIKEEAQDIPDQNMYIVDGGDLAFVSDNNISVMNQKDGKNNTKLEENNKKLKDGENIQKNLIRKRRITTNGKKEESVKRRKTKKKVEKATCDPTESAIKMDDTSKISLELTDHSENIDNIHFVDLAGQIKIRKQKCRKCDFRYTSGDQSYKQHWLENHQNQQQCELCDWVGPWKRDLAKHMYRKHDEAVACPDRYPLQKCTFQGCNYTTLCLFMYIHVRGHVGKKEIQRMCEICGASLAGEHSLQRHIRLQHSGSKVKTCSICNKIFECKMELRKHMISTHGSPFVCHLCPYKTDSSFHLDLHLHKKHGIEIKQKKLVCDQCDFYCFITKQLNDHKLIHNTSTLELEQYKCSQCEKTCKSSSSLRQHIHTVHSAKRYKCTLCDYEGKTKIALKRHMSNRHSDERPFSCHLCSYTCKVRENVHKHLKHAHKLKVVTRASMFNNMIKTGKGFDQVKEMDKNGAPLLIMEPEGNIMEAMETKSNLDNLDTEGTEETMTGMQSKSIVTMK